MPGAMATLFRRSWGRTAATLGVLASTMAIVGMGFRYIARDAVHRTGYCAPSMVDGTDVYCAMGVGLARIAGGLTIGAIVVAGLALWATWQAWHQGRAGSGTDH